MADTVPLEVEIRPNAGAHWNFSELICLLHRDPPMGRARIESLIPGKASLRQP